MNRISRENEPGHINFPVSDAASSRLSDNRTQYSDPEKRRRRCLLEELSNNDPILGDILPELKLAWGLQDEAAVRYEDGFLLGYKLLSEEAEITRLPLTEIAPETVDDFILWLHPGYRQWASMNHYCDDRLTSLYHYNDNYLKGVINGTFIREDRQTSTTVAFMAGALNIYDIM
jgi:hypothetical protein